MAIPWRFPAATIHCQRYELEDIRKEQPTEGETSCAGGTDDVDCGNVLCLCGPIERERVNDPCTSTENIEVAERGNRSVNRFAKTAKIRLLLVADSSGLRVDRRRPVRNRVRLKPSSTLARSTTPTRMAKNAPRRRSPSSSHQYAPPE